jgi:predicted alpha/beta superfamily hydrolase
VLPRCCLAFVTLMALVSGAAAGTRPHSALPSVHVLPPLAMPGLDRQRTLRVYLPPGYADTSRRFPVLYMHDGQNLFDDATSYAGEWGVDEALDALAKSHGLEVLVVGIDNGQEQRMSELNPWPGLMFRLRFGPAEGEEYMDFVVKVVKPWIDAHYRTLPDRANTAIMGSSMGGLIADYAIHRYPQVFSKAGIFSPSYWVSDDAYEFAGERPLPRDARVVLLSGGKEGEDTVEDLNRMTTVLRGNGLGSDRLSVKVPPDGEHNETFWRREFPAAVTWLFDARPVAAMATPAAP